MVYVMAWRGMVWYMVWPGGHVMGNGIGLADMEKYMVWPDDGI